MQGAGEGGPLGAAGRAGTRARLAGSLRALLQARDPAAAPPGEAAAEAAAEAIEARAFAKAEATSRTTTGARPRREVLQVYARAAGELVQRVLAEGLGAVTGAPAGAALTAGGRFSLEGEREFLSEASARAALAPVLEGGACAPGELRALKLSTKSFGDDSVGPVLEALQVHAQGLQEADVSDCVSGRREEEALRTLERLSEALACCPALEALDISDNALGEKGVRRFAAVLRAQPRLRSLGLLNIGCSPQACAAVAELLGAPEELRRLHLFNNMSDDAGALSIAGLLRSTAIEDFRMGSSRVKEVGGAALAEALAGKALQRVDLSDNPMGPSVGPAFGAMFAGSPARTLTHCNLSELCLEDEGLVALAGGLASCAALEVLELGANEMTKVGARALARAMGGLGKLRVLNVRENELGNKGAAAIAGGVASCPALETLDMYQNEIQADGALAVARALAGKPGLVRVDLNANYIAEESLEELQFVVREATAGRDVLADFDENEPDLAEEGEEDSEDEE